MGKKGKLKQGNQKAKEAKAASSSGGKTKLTTCKFVKARHILCEKQSKILQAQKELEEISGNVTPEQFGKIAQKYSECSSAKRGGDLGWFGRGKMVAAFQDVAFGTEPGKISAPFKTQHGYHIVYVEGRKN